MFLFLLPLDLFSTSNLKQIFFKFLHELEVRNKTGMVNNTSYNQLQQFEPPTKKKDNKNKPMESRYWLWTQIIILHNII